MTVALAPNPFFFWVTPQGQPAVGYQLSTYVAGTSIPQATYTDSTQTQQNTNPVVLNAYGYASVWLVTGLTYKLILTDAAGNVVGSQDQIPGGITAAQIIAVLTAQIIGGILYPQTIAEANASVIPNTAYEYGDMRRYNIVPNSTAAAGTNYTAIAALFNPAITNGPTGRFYFVNTTGTDTYYFNEMVMVRDGVWIDGQDCTLSFGFSGTPITANSNDSNSGCLTAIRNFTLENVSIVVYGATNSITSTLNCIQLGVRSNGTPRWPIAIYDASLAVPMGNIKLKNVRLLSNITGAQLSSVGSIASTGGLQNVDIENLVMNGGGNLTQGFTYEFGFATSTINGSDVSMRQSSHMRNLRMKNITVINFDNVSAVSAGIIMDVPYSVSIDGYYFSGVSNGFVSQPGECGYLFPWQPGGILGNDATGAKRNIQLKNIVGDNFSSAGLSIDGTWAATPGSGYHTNNWLQSESIIQFQTVMPAPTAWQQGHVYVAGNRVTANGHLWNCTTGGTSLGSGIGPSGTGSHLTSNAFNDNGVIWDYYPWQLFQAQGAGITLGSGQGPFIAYGTAAPLTFSDNGITWLMLSPQCFTDLMDMEIDGVALNGSTNSYGIFSKLGRLQLKNFTITGCQRGVVTSDECTQFDIDGFRILGMQFWGIQMDGTGGVVDIFNPPRLKRGRIANGKIAGCSAASAGTYPAINLAWADGVTIEKMQFGHEIRNDYQDELTQAAGVQFGNINAPVSNCKISNCRFGGAVGGIAMYTAQGLGNSTLSNTYEDLSLNTAGSGLALLPLTNPISATLQTAITGAWEPILISPSADRGDNTVNLFAHVDFQQQVFNTPLTAGRTATLGTSGAIQGDKFTVTRTKLATGASTLSVVGATTTTLAVGTWCTYTYNGNTANWYETAAGSL